MLAAARKATKLNSWAICVKQNSDLLPRPKGKLWWEESSASSSRTAHEGNLQLLHSKHDEGLDGFKAEAEKQREAGRRCLETMGKVKQFTCVQFLFGMMLLVV